jgi:hypothetical protein
MTDEEHRALDREVAEKVMGTLPREVRIRGSDETVTIFTDNPYYSDGQCGLHELRWVTEPPAYSTEIELAWLVVERMKADPFGIGPDFELLWGPEEPEDAEEQWVAVFGAKLKPGQCVVESYGSTAPLAICRAVLAAVAKRNTVREEKIGNDTSHP